MAASGILGFAVHVTAGCVVEGVAIRPMGEPQVMPSTASVGFNERGAFRIFLGGNLEVEGPRGQVVVTERVSIPHVCRQLQARIGFKVVDVGSDHGVGDATNVASEVKDSGVVKMIAACVPSKLTVIAASFRDAEPEIRVAV